MSFIWIAYGVLLLEAVELFAKALLPVGLALLIYRSVLRGGHEKRAWGGPTVDIIICVIVALSAAVLIAFWSFENF